MLSLRRRYVLRGTATRRVLWALVVFLLITATAETLVEYAKPCSALQISCDDTYFLGLIDILQVFASFGSSSVLGLYRFFVQTALSQRLSRQPDHWTMASSRDVFAECSQVVKSAQNATLALIGGMTVLGAAVRVIDVVAQPYSYYSGEDWRPKVEAVCGRRHNMCHLAYTSYMPFFMATSGGMLYLFGIYLLTPARALSPIFQEAARQERDWRHTRLPLLAWAVMILGLTSFALATHLSFRIVALRGSATEMSAYLVASVGLLLGQAAIIVWFSSLQRVRLWPQWFCSIWRSVISVIRNALSLLSSPGTSVKALTTGLWSSHRSAFLSFEASLRFRHLVLLLLHVYLWVFNTITSAWAYNAIMWALRALAFALLLLTHDAPANFYDLLEQPGFGLVADKRDLCRALKANLAGKGYRGEVRRYKASTLRMQETLAVSYRWQPDQVELSDGFGFNMSRWQMEQLLSVLQGCNCHYVWIDHISIPQLGFSDMKRTLLSRMMAVYASAGYTLVLRSLELEGCRYHQRGWTLQEYCNASRVIVLTQEEPQSDIESSYAAVQGDEEEMAGHMREEQLRKVVGMKPFWLYGGGVEEMEEAEVVRREETYLGLVGRLYAEEPADLVRALYPLVFDRPVESHEELMELVSQISSRTASNLLCSNRAALDLRLLISSYTRGEDILSRVASRVTNSGAAELMHRIKRETASGGKCWVSSFNDADGNVDWKEAEGDMGMFLPGSGWNMASCGSIPSSFHEDGPNEIVALHGPSLHFDPGA